MVNNSQRPRRIRLTRRGWVALTVTGAVVIGIAVAVPLLLRDDESAQPQTLLIPEGWRSLQVYEAVDKALAVAPGTTKRAVDKAGLKLPDDAGGNPEGYFFPATYPISDKSTPASLLSFMVNTANKKFGEGKIAAGAERNAVTAYQAVTIASIVQSEGETKQDMGKVARVIYNRLDRGMPLQMDSTINYALGRTTLETKASDTRIQSPYNTYARTGLPPTPIANPGQEAVEAAINPPQGDWLYFVTVKPGDTRFTADFQEQQRNVAEFNRLQEEAKKAEADKAAAKAAAEQARARAAH